MFAKLPLVTLFISNLTRLTAVVCMKVRFEAKVTRGFSLSPRRFRDSLSPLALDLFQEEKSRKTSGTRVVFFPTDEKVRSGHEILSAWHVDDSSRQSYFDCVPFAGVVRIPYSPLFSRDLNFASL